MAREPYYDHEDGYKKLKEIGGKAFADLQSDKSDDPMHPFHEFLEFIRSNYAPKGGRAIDLGCGGGQVSFILCDYSFEVVGIDYSQTAIEIAGENAKELGKQVTFERGDILDLKGIVSESFDLVVDNHVSHCILPQDRERYFSETSRILKPKGIYFGTVMAIREPSKPEEIIDMDVDPETRIYKSGKRYVVTRDEFIQELVSHRLFPLSIKEDNFDRPSYMDLTIYAKKRKK